MQSVYDCCVRCHTYDDARLAEVKQQMHEVIADIERLLKQLKYVAMVTEWTARAGCAHLGHYVPYTEDDEQQSEERHDQEDCMGLLRAPGATRRSTEVHAAPLFDVPG